MKTFALLASTSVLTMVSSGVASAATGSDLVEAVRSFVSTGIANGDSSFRPLRGDSIKLSPGEHYHVNRSFGPFMPDCHVSGYATRNEWVLSCSSPGLGAVNVRQLLGLIYRGAVRGMPACFTRTLDPLVLADETFRWDCRQADKAFSVDVSTERSANGDPSFLFEVYEYGSAPPPQPTPSPTAVPITIHVVKPQKTLDMAGVQVPYADYLPLDLEIYASAVNGKDPALVHVTRVLKGGAEMPPYDWTWHYAGKQTQNGLQTIEVWVCVNLSPSEQLVAQHQGTLLGLLDAGSGGPVLQGVYAKAKAADDALGPNAADPFVNRRKLVYEIWKYFT